MVSQNLLSRSDVLFLLENPGTTHLSRNPLYRKRRIESKKRTLSRSMTKSYSTLAANRNAEQKLLNHQQQSSSTLRLLQENIKSQCNNLNARLFERRNRNSSDFDKSTDTSFNDIESPEKLYVSFDEYELMIAEVYEDLIEQKQAERIKIIQKYQEEIRELREMEQSDLVESVVKEMKTKMKAEISKADEQFEHFKKEKLGQIRKEFGTQSL